jgi:hypothetical protein
LPNAIKNRPNGEILPNLVTLLIMIKNRPKNRPIFGLLNLLKNSPQTFKNRPIGEKLPNLVTLLIKKLVNQK